MPICRNINCHDLARCTLSFAGLRRNLCHEHGLSLASVIVENGGKVTLSAL